MSRRGAALAAAVVACIASPGAGPAVASPAPAARASGTPDRPFSAGSAWNTPVPADARTGPVPGLAGLPAGLSSGLAPDGVSVPVLAARRADPAVAVLRNPRAWERLASGAWRTAGNPPEVEAEIRRTSTATFPLAHHPYASQSAATFAVGPEVAPIRRLPDGTAPRVRVPAGARGSGNADSHMVVFQPDGSAFESYATIVLSDRTVVCLTYQVTRISGRGDGVEDGVTASLIPVYAGLVRRADVAAGAIRHALKIVVPAGLLATGYVPPARAFDRGALTERPPYSGSLPMGARLALPPGTDLDGLGLETPVGRMLAAASRSYGLVVTDRGGAGVTVIVEAGALPDPDPGVARDLGRILARARRVLPAGPDGAAGRPGALDKG